MENKRLNKTYIPIIDGLRALAVLIVFLFHLKIPGFNGGFIGVDIFFVISGYLITSIYFSEKRKNNKFSFLNYFRKRIFRLFPSLIFVILLSLLFGYILLSPSDLIEISKSAIYSILFLSNIYFFLDSSYWANLNEYKFFIHTWSLGIEMTFYILMPFFLFLIHRFNNKIKFLICLFTIVISIFLIIFLISKGPTIESVKLFGLFYGKEVSDILFYLIPFRFFEFLFGSLIFFLPEKKFNQKIKQLFFLVGLGLIFYSLYLVSPDHKYQSLLITISLIGSSLIIYFKDASHINKILNNKIAIFIGLISYSLYLVHWPMISYFKYILVNEISLIMKLIILILSILISFLIYKFIEIPFRNKKFSLRLVPLFVGIFLIIFLSSFFKNNNGFVDRLNEEQKKLLANITDQKETCERIFSTVYKLKYKICLHGNEIDSKIIVLGDSNATTWFPLAKKLAEKDNSSVVNYRRICNSFPKDSVLNCYEIDPTAEILIIGSLWFNWQSKVNEIETRTKKYIENINDLNKNANFKEIKKIIIFGQIPALKNENINIMSCLLKPKFLNLSQDCGKIYSHIGDENELLQNYKKVNFYLEKYGNEILKKNFEFLFIDPIKSLCKSNECIQFRNEKIFYLNNNHLSSAAVNYIYEEKKETIEKFLIK